MRDTRGAGRVRMDILGGAPPEARLVVVPVEPFEERRAIPPKLGDAEERDLGTPPLRFGLDPSPKLPRLACLGFDRFALTCFS